MLYEGKDDQQLNSTVFCIGELLIDFFCKDVDVDLVKGQHFEKQAGGAPANVCAAVVKLGGRAVFCGKVGKDPFGDFLKNVLNELGVDTSMIVADKDHPTTLAFVSLKRNGERDFIFNRGADAFLTDLDLEKKKIMKSNILHFGSATALLADPFQATYRSLMSSAKQSGKVVSFDPNYREDLWKGKEKVFINRALEVMPLADFIKVSDDELELITGESNPVKGVKKLHDLGAGTIAVTLGKEGTLVSNGVHHEIVPSIAVKSIDSTGAGDAFVGAMLYQLSQEKQPLFMLKNFDYLKEIVAFSNKTGAMVCTKTGAISAIPTNDEVKGYNLEGAFNK